jgi:hypothetical protein
MANFYLKAKHWQLFVLIFVIPVTFQIILAIGVFSSLMTAAMAGQEPNPFVMVDYIKWFPLVMIFYLAAYYGWFWTIGTQLQRLVPQGVTLKVGRFKVLLLIPVIYLVTVMTLLVFFFNNFNPAAMEAGNMPDVSLLPIFMVIFIPLHFFAMFCIFHSMYFVAKTIKTVELQREVSFSDFVAEFFMLWFYFIGIWILQPKINKMVEALEAKG